jgi:hypothetical protein
MENLRHKLEDITHRIDQMRRQLAQIAHGKEISSAQYQMQVTYLGHLEERARGLLAKLHKASADGLTNVPPPDALIELFGPDTSLHAPLADTFRQRMVLAQRFCRTLSDILRVITKRSILSRVLPWHWSARRGMRRISSGVARSYQEFIKEAGRFAFTSRDILRTAPSPIASRDNLRAAVGLLSEIDRRSLTLFLANRQSDCAKSKALEDIR